MQRQMSVDIDEKRKNRDDNLSDVNRIEKLEAEILSL